MKKILIAGDSFAYDHGDQRSWPTRLGRRHQVTNVAQCGCGQYKILLQLRGQDLSRFDEILIFHTSPNRLYLATPNTMMPSPSHRDADLLFADVESKRHRFDLARVAYEYFVTIYDQTYQDYVHALVCKDLEQMTLGFPVRHFTNFDYTNLYHFQQGLRSYHGLWQQHPGDINHYDARGNELIFEDLLDFLE